MGLPLRRALRIVFASSFGLGTMTLLVAACVGEDAPIKPLPDGAGLPQLTDEGGSDAFVPDTSTGTDGGTDATDASTDAPADVVVDVVSGDAKAGDPCTFNRECQANLRCECTEADGCECKVGVRGTGQNGVTQCDSGNQCASSLCVEGQAKTFYCSDECKTGADCKPNLPQCSSVAFIGKICIR